VLAAATDLGFGHILNPFFIATSIYRTGKDYFVALLASAVVILLGMAVTTVVTLVFKAIGITFVVRWIPETVGLYAPFVAAGFLGHLLWVHGEVLDWGRSEDYQRPVLPGVVPRGQYTPKAKEVPAANLKPHPQPVFLTDSVPAIDLNPSNPSVTPPANPPADLSSNPPARLADPPTPPPPSPSQVDLQLTSGLASLLNLSTALGNSPEPEAPRLDQRGPSELKIGLNSGIQPPAQPPPPAPPQRPAAPASADPAADPLMGRMLEAQAYYSSGESGPIDLPPALPSLPVITSPAPATVLQAPTPPPPGHTAPTRFGFSPALPSSENRATRLGHQAVQPPTPPPTEPKKG